MLTRAGLAITILLSSTMLQAQSYDSHRGIANNTSQIDLSVTVHTSTGEPAPNARIELRDMGLGAASFTGYTNSAGVAQIAHVPDGTYNLVVTYKLAEVQQRANLAFGEHSLNINLPPDTTGSDRGSPTSVSVAAYKVPDKAL